MLRTGQDQQPGLRERKKARTRASLREHALRLFREQGYQATTVEQIAAAAEVSPSTFFRYFPTKEDVILQDDMDTRMIEALEQQPPELGSIAAMRAAIRQQSDSYSAEEVDVLTETAKLSMTVPEIRARAIDEFARAITGLSEALARRAGRPAGRLGRAHRGRSGHRRGHVGHHALGRLAGATPGYSSRCSWRSTGAGHCSRPACRSSGPRPWQDSLMYRRPAVISPGLALAP